ncbi:MAG: hypothetical protein AAF802_31860, partial [Planctomycetota bacterium]
VYIANGKHDELTSSDVAKAFVAAHRKRGHQGFVEIIPDGDHFFEGADSGFRWLARLAGL